MARKPGKLPYKTIKESYTKEYGTDSIEIHVDAIDENDVVLIHDDLLTTGGTIKAAWNLVKKFNPKKCYMNFVVEIHDEGLHGRDFIGEGNKLDIVFAVLSDSEREKGRKILQSIAPDLACAVKRNWRTLEMPEQRDAFILRRTFTPEQMSTLRRGHVPWQMEDKWFWYMEGSTLWTHRSWTGYCIYQIDFKDDDHHIVTVNRDPEQYECISIEEDIMSLNKLLDWWTKPPYDHYNEWLSETYDALKKAGR
jgi:hypoxanthine phosphoribosyltransferase